MMLVRIFRYTTGQTPVFWIKLHTEEPHSLCWPPNTSIINVTKLRYVSLLQNLQTESGEQPASLPFNVAEGSFPGGKVARVWCSPITSVLLYGYEWDKLYLCSPHTPSWLGQGEFYLYLYLYLLTNTIRAIPAGNTRQTIHTWGR